MTSNYARASRAPCSGALQNVESLDALVLDDMRSLGSIESMVPGSIAVLVQPAASRASDRGVGDVYVDTCSFPWRACRGPARRGMLAIAVSVTVTREGVCRSRPARIRVDIATSLIVRARRRAVALAKAALALAKAALALAKAGTCAGEGGDLRWRRRHLRWRRRGL